MTELKTLKDMPECNILVQHIDTTKDILDLTREEMKFEKGYFTADLREEAIEWIKEIDYQQQKKLTGDNIIYSEEVLEGMRNWIKMFFNLTEEEKNDIKNFERF